MAELTIEAFLTRLRDTEYLPDWANEAAAGFLSDTPPEPEAMTISKWCPFARVATATLRGSHNRIWRQTEDGKDVYGLRGAYCITDHCQMWTGTDCGVKNSPAASV